MPSPSPAHWNQKWVSSRTCASARRPGSCTNGALPHHRGLVGDATAIADHATVPEYGGLGVLCRIRRTYVAARLWRRHRGADGSACFMWPDRRLHAAIADASR